MVVVVGPGRSSGVYVACCSIVQATRIRLNVVNFPNSGQNTLARYDTVLSQFLEDNTLARYDGGT